MSSHKEKNIQIAAKFLESNSCKRDDIGVLKAAKAIEECDVEIQLGAASAMHNIGPSFGQQVVIFCILPLPMYIHMHFDRSMQSSRNWHSQWVEREPRKEAGIRLDQKA